MTPEQRDVTRNALRKYGERHWARTPENRRWQSAIDEGLDYYQAHDPMRADLLSILSIAENFLKINNYSAFWK